MLCMPHRSQDTHLASQGVVEALSQRHNCGLARPRLPHKSHSAACWHSQAEVPEDRDIRARGICRPIWKGVSMH